MTAADRLLEFLVDEHKPEYSKPFAVGAWVIATKGCAILAIKAKTSLTLLPCPPQVRRLVGQMLVYEPEQTISIAELLSWCQSALERYKYGSIRGVPIDLDLLVDFLSKIPWEKTYLQKAPMTAIPALFLGGPDWSYIQAAMVLNDPNDALVFENSVISIPGQSDTEDSPDSNSNDDALNENFIHSRAP